MHGKVVRQRLSLFELQTLHTITFSVLDTLLHTARLQCTKKLPDQEAVAGPFSLFQSALGWLQLFPPLLHVQFFGLLSFCSVLSPESPSRALQVPNASPMEPQNLGTPGTSLTRAQQAEKGPASHAHVFLQDYRVRTKLASLTGRTTF